MKELIKITEKEGQQLVSAKELHAFLDIETRFDIWIKRMFEYGFVQDVDYQRLNKNVHTHNGGLKEVLSDYVLTLDTAKEISMIQRTEKGKIARQYFIECEKKLKQIVNQHHIPQTYGEALKLAYEQQLKIEEQEKVLQEQEPMVNFAKALYISKNSILIGQLAKLLTQNGLKIGQNKLFEVLRDKGYLLTKGEQYNMPSQTALEHGLFEIKTTTINNPDGSVRVTRTTKVTPKGQEFFINKLLF